MRKKIKRLALSLLIAVLMVALMVTPALAYKATPYKLPTTLTFTPYRGFGAESIQHMGLSAGQWNAAAGGSTLLKISSSTHSEAAGYAKRDGKNYIYRMDVGADYVAQCAYWPDYNLIQESDININVYYSYANSAQPNCYDLYTVFLHETGHAVGLADLYESSDSAAVMYGTAFTNMTKRSLTQDDITGVNYIYR